MAGTVASYGQATCRYMIYAYGGIVIYHNKSNLSITRSVYSKNLNYVFKKICIFNALGIFNDCKIKFLFWGCVHDYFYILRY